ncbi:AraC family transcriptional regulator [Paenibacillus solisilvae]|uniref:AraC family transcriptional regulator n=1 Tax=Paenibacillus solisilvae TaxID=2486751 RepID=A0ABW0VTD7_9BACL
MFDKERLIPDASKDSFYLLKYEYKKSSPARAGSFQSHDNYEIFYFHEGQGNYLIGDRIHSLVPGTLIIMHGMTLHSPSSLEGHPYVRTLINFDPTYIRAASEQLFDVDALEPFVRLSNYMIRLESAEKAEFETILAKMDRLYSLREPAASDRFRLAFLDVLFVIYGLLQKPVLEQSRHAKEKDQHVGQALAYLEQHFRDEVTLAQLERELHLNRSYLSRIFRKVTGVTIFNYLYRRRINQAKIEFLIEPNRSVTDICYLSGFSNLSHFSRVFKQLEGISPNEYRRMIIKSISAK